MLSLTVLFCLIISGKAGWEADKKAGTREYILWRYIDAGYPQYKHAHIRIDAIDDDDILPNDGTKGKNVHAAYDRTFKNPNNQDERWYWDSTSDNANKWTKAKQNKATLHYGLNTSGVKYKQAVDPTLKALYIKFFDEKKILINDESEKISAHYTHYADYYHDDDYYVGDYDGSYRDYITQHDENAKQPLSHQYLSAPYVEPQFVITIFLSVLCLLLCWLIVCVISSVCGFIIGRGVTKKITDLEDNDDSNNTQIRI